MSVQLNADFNLSTMTAQELNATVAAWQKGAMSTKGQVNSAIHLGCRRIYCPCWIDGVPAFRLSEAELQEDLHHA